MKTYVKRTLALALTLCMVLAMVPSAVFATTTVTPSPNTGNSSVNSLEVEYFTSTLYNWDESAANAATALVDQTTTTTTSWNTTSVSYNGNGNYSTYTSGSYYVLVNGEYYVVTAISCTRSGMFRYTYSWTVTYDGGTATGSNSTFTLYYQTTSTDTTYEGKGFYFTNSGNKGDDVPSFSSWVTNAGYDQNYMIYSGLAASNLSNSSNAPFNDEVVNAANLFATDGSNSAYTDVYTNVQVPFVYDAETGYYTLDSDTYGVYFSDPDNIASDGAVMSIADLPMGYYAYTGSYYYKCGYAPFNTPSSSYDTERQYEQADGTKVDAYVISESMTYGFGMTTTIPFQMTDDGTDGNGNAITFEFSGDDDVWVYIDDVLVLDIGGTHDAITGTINFATGDVMLTAKNYSYIGDKATGTVESTNTMSQTNLYTALGTTLTAFASEGTHTMTIYYMDRGQGRTNCLMKFNLPQKDSVSVTKTIDEYYDNNSDYKISDAVMTVLNNIDFTFTLYKDGAVVANKSYSLYDATGTFVGTGSTDANGTFTIKNGYTATFRNISLDTESSYYVVETSPGDRWTAEWTASSSVSSATISGGSGLTSDTVTVTGSSTSTDTISFVCNNVYSYGSVQPDVDCNDDTIVLDYGLPVQVDVLANDNMTAYGVAVASTMTLVGADEDGKVTGTYGDATIVDGKIVYTLTKDFCGIESIQYTVTASVTNDETGEVTTQSGTATLTIIPATSVYYEESFSDMVTATAEFSSTGEAMTGYQETGFVGTTTDSTYGTDALYLNNLGDSYGTSLKATTTDHAAQFSYSFTGTGTTIYGRVNNVTGYIRVTVKDSGGTTVDTQFIDTINLVTKTDDGQILDTTLYNIPIYQDTALPSGYDTYTVTVYVYKAGVFHEDNSEFYLDGIRVYNPMGTSTADNEGYTTASSAYATDGEANTAVINIREKALADAKKGYSDDVITLTDVNGYIEDVTEYSTIGPNQELYLEDGYNASFALLNWDSQSYKLYLGLKAPNGTSATVTVNEYEIEINNSADCYYDISDYVTVDTTEDGETVGYVTVSGSTGLAAITNIKVTGVDAFNLGYSSDYNGSNEGESSAGATETLYLVSTAYAASLSEEEEEEVTAFTPESISITCSYATKTKRATVTVSTSKDVSYVTINGVKLTPKSLAGLYRFSQSYTKVAAGTTYEIVCYNADGVASEVYTVIAE